LGAEKEWRQDLPYMGKGGKDQLGQGLGHELSGQIACNGVRTRRGFPAKKRGEGEHIFMNRETNGYGRGKGISQPCPMNEMVLGTNRASATLINGRKRHSNDGVF